MLSSSSRFSFQPGTLLPEAIKDRMAVLLFATSHLEYCSYANKLSLPLAALQRRQNIDPYLGQLRAMFDDQHKFAGFFTAATMARFGAVATTSYYRDEMRDMDTAYDTFVAAHAAPDDFLVASMALEERYRGQGLFKSMFEEIVRVAREQGSRRIVLTVWERNPAMVIYLKKGFRIRASFDYAYPLFFEHLHFLEYDLDTLTRS